MYDVHKQIFESNLLESQIPPLSPNPAAADKPLHFNPPHRAQRCLKIVIIFIARTIHQRIINGSKRQRKNDVFYALDCTIAWVTQPERPKGALTSSKS